MEIHFSCGKCGQRIAADESGAGQTIRCPACEEDLVVPASVQASASAPVGFLTEVKTNVRQGAAIGGWVCFVVGIIIMVLVMIFQVPAWFTLYLCGPFLLVSFILGIVAMAQGRVASGLLLLLANFIGAPVVGAIAAAVLSGVWSNAVSGAKERAASINCESNLKAIGLAARSYSQDHGGRFPVDFLSMSNELITPKMLVCSDDHSRTRASSWAEFSSANVSYENLVPEAKEADVLKKPVFRCAIHNHAWYGDGTVVRGNLKLSTSRLASAEAAPKFAALDAKNGFRDLALGTPLNTFSGLKPTPMFSSQGDEKRFNIESFDPKLGEFEISQIVLVFDTEILKEIIVYTGGKQNVAGLRESLTQAYGAPQKAGMINDDLVWRGNKVVLSFHASFDESAWATFRSKEVEAKLKAAVERNAKEGAEEAAKKL